jgi:hypothetical protein
LVVFTTRFPVVAPTGTTTTMEVALHEVTVAAVPLKVTEPAPWLAPKPEPVIVTVEPTAPEFILRLEMVGGVMSTVLSVYVKTVIGTELSAVKAAAGGTALQVVPVTVPVHGARRMLYDKMPGVGEAPQLRVTLGVCAFVVAAHIAKHRITPLPIFPTALKIFVTLFIAFICDILSVLLFLIPLLNSQKSF